METSWEGYHWTFFSFDFVSTCFQGT